MNQSPTVTLVFSGLYLFAFGKDKQFCQAGIMEADRHCLKVKIVTTATKTGSSSQMEFEIPEGDVFFEIPGRTPGIGTYATGAFDRTASHDNKDFRWVLDLEGAELHNRKLSTKANAIKRTITISNGLFYNHEGRPVRITATASQTRDVEIARKIGCAVYLGEDEAAVLRYGPNSSFSIKLSNAPNVRYEIFLDNICPETTPPGDGDFERYYDVVEVPADEQFKVKLSPTAPPSPGDPRSPCDPVFMGISEAPL